MCVCGRGRGVGEGGRMGGRETQWSDLVSDEQAVSREPSCLPVEGAECRKESFGTNIAQKKVSV